LTQPRSLVLEQSLAASATVQCRSSAPASPVFPIDNVFVSLLPRTSVLLMLLGLTSAFGPHADDGTSNAWVPSEVLFELPWFALNPSPRFANARQIRHWLAPPVSFWSASRIPSRPSTKPGLHG